MTELGEIQDIGKETSIEYMQYNGIYSPCGANDPHQQYQVRSQKISYVARMDGIPQYKYSSN